MRTQTNPAQAQPRIIGSHGLLPVAQSDAILRDLEKQGKTSLLEKHLAFTEALKSTPLVTGNSVRLLIDGPATYQAMFEAMSAAKHHINLETYILDDDEIGRKFAALLIEKQAQGVQVNLMYDGVGAISTSSDFFKRMQDNGIHVCEFNPINPLRGRFFSLNNRDHRKLLIVDGKIGFTGGINISEVYASSIFKRKKKRAKAIAAWRDTQIEIRGPAVRELQHLFLGNWTQQKCTPQSDADYFPSMTTQGDTVVKVIGSRSGEKINMIYASLLSAIAHAERSIDITMAYFVPDKQFIDALKQAAQRGVDVKLVMPGFSDYWVTFQAGRSHYTDLLSAGVKIFERDDALLHAKTAVIDGVWSTVGSSNMDFRSFLHNDEVNVVVLGEDFAQQMEAMFEDDVAESSEITLDEWKQRRFKDKFKEGVARLWEYWL